MQLIGMLDSPYVRRVAISLRLLDIPFEHDPLSVFSTFDRFSRINPVVKAPTLVCDDGTVLMDSTLILDHLETIAGRSLSPAGCPERLRADCASPGLACSRRAEKVVQDVYERHLRPPRETPSAVEDDRVATQMLAALTALDAELAAHPLATDEARLTQAGVTAAIAWRFMQIKLEQPVEASDCPSLAAYCERLGALPAFAQTPPVETANVSTVRR